MPGRLFLITPVEKIALLAGVASGSILNDPPRHNVQPGENLIVITSVGVIQMRWGLIPVGRVNARGRPVMETVINARSESVFDKSAFAGVTRGVIPADGWYEWTGEKRHKQPWRIKRKDGAPLWFAAICDVWNGPGGITLPQTAAITCEPNDDVRHVHHRMGVLLAQNDIQKWLGPDEGVAKSVMVQPKSGALKVEPADDVDWNAP
jgi:putative SOS response-associated peptidase YedK